MNKFSKIFVTIFGIGYFPIAPGTLGSLTTLVITYFFIDKLSIFILLFLTLFIFLISIQLVSLYSKTITEHDASEIIIDESIGILFILSFYEYIKFANNFIMFICIFFLFRFFDIYKPFPVNWVDKNLKNSFGILLDDLLAGGYCIIILLLINVLL